MLVRCGTSMDPMEMKSVADGGAETDPDRRPNIYNEMFDSRIRYVSGVWRRIILVTGCHVVSETPKSGVDEPTGGRKSANQIKAHSINRSGRVAVAV